MQGPINSRINIVHKILSSLHFLFPEKDIGELDISCNNLRIIPPDIKKLTNLVHLDLSRNGIRCTNAQDYSGLPKELGHLPHLLSICISECNLPFIPAAIWRCRSLRYLDISRNKINFLAPDIGNLEKLQFFNAQQTSIMTLPPEIALCQELQEILLWGNVIESLPETLKELPKLKILAINYRSFGANVDDYRNGLLQTGQIQSEHIPPVLFEIPSLDHMDLDETKLNVLPEMSVGKYMEFHLARNFFQNVPEMILKMEVLQVLDLSGNLLQVIPDHIDRLVNLRNFQVDENQLESLPLTIGNLGLLENLSLGKNKLSSLPETIRNLGKLKSLILNENVIEVLPDTIADLEQLETLDLTANQLVKLPISFHRMKKLKAAHSYQKFHKYGLWLHKNPLKVPPQEVWKTDNPERIYSYLKRLQIQKIENLQRQKLFVFGESQCGKTSLVNTMRLGRSAITTQTTDSTSMVDFLSWKTENNVDFLVCDMGGNDIYKITHPLFLDPNSLYIIVYDHRKYTPQNHRKAIGCWLDMLSTYVPGAVVKIVGTQIDQCNLDFVEKIQEQVEEEIQAQLRSREQHLQQEIDSLETRLATETSTEQWPTRDQWYRQHRRLLTLQNTPLRLQPVSLVSSSTEMPGVSTLINDLELLAVNADLFPHAQRIIPDNWLTFSARLKSHTGFYVHWKGVLNIANSSDISKSELKDCLACLADRGDILWYKDKPQLKRFIFQAPKTLVSILQGLFPNHLDVFLDFHENRVFAAKGNMNVDTFEKAKLELLQKGHISRELLQCLWFYLKLDLDSIDVLLDLIPRFDICFVLPQPDFPPPRSVYYPLMVLPSFNHLPITDSISTIWNSAADQNGLTEAMLNLRFPHLYPDGLFEKIICRTQERATSFTLWQDLLVAEMDDTDVMLRRYLLPETYDCILELAVKAPQISLIKGILKVLVQDIKVLLESYSGLVWYLTSDMQNCGNAKFSEVFPPEVVLL